MFYLFFSSGDDSSFYELLLDQPVSFTPQTNLDPADASGPLAPA